MVNSVNNTFGYNGYNELKIYQQVDDEDVSVFSTSEYQTSPITGEISFSGAEVTEECTVEDLKAEYEQIQKGQGIVGKAWNGIKNALPFLSKLGWQGSNEIEEIIAKAEKGEISTEEAKEAIEKYKKNQENGTETALTTATATIATVACLLAGPVGWGALIAIGIGAGIASRVGLGALEAGTNEIEGDYTGKDIVEDAGKGAIIGLVSSIFKGLGLKGGKGAVIREVLEPDKKVLGAATKGFLLAAN